jgi:hypothetical protein
MSRHEAPEVGSAVLRMMNGLIRRAADGDQEAVEALAAIESFAPNATNAALTVSPYSYGELAPVMGTSRAAVQQRVGRAKAAECGHYTCLGMKRCRA